MSAMMNKALSVVLVPLLLVAASAVAQDSKQFPDIEFIDLSGQVAHLPAVLGKATILNFWATWCGPCRMELPELQRLYNQNASRGLVVAAVNVDAPTIGEDALSREIQLVRPRIEAFARDTGITLPIYLVDGRTQAELGLNRIPVTVLLDDKGDVVQVYAGFSEAAMRDLRQRVDTLLAKPKRGKKGA